MFTTKDATANGAMLVSKFDSYAAKQYGTVGKQLIKDLL